MTTETMIEPGAPSAEQQRTYVFCPSEPFLTVWVGGRALKFNNGRLVSTHYQRAPGANQRRELSDSDLAYFRQEEQRATARGEEPKYVVFDGELDDPITKQVLANYLRERVMHACSRKAWAADPQKVMDDTALTLAAMMATDDGLPDVRNMPQDMPGLVRTMERTMPSAGKMLRDMIEMSRGFSMNASQDYADMMNAGAGGADLTDARKRDEEAIRNAVNGSATAFDTPTPPPAETPSPFAGA